MEQSVLREVVLSHIHALKEERPADSDWKPAPQSMVNAWLQHTGLPFLSDTLMISHAANRCHIDDVVCISQPSSMAKVRFHVKYGEGCFSLVNFFEKCGPNTFRMPPDAGSHFVSTHLIEGALAYKKLDDERILVAPQSFYKSDNLTYKVMKGSTVSHS